MNPAEAMIEVVRRWTAIYTRGLPESAASRREAELEADLHDHVTHDRDRGESPRSTAMSMASRLIRGAPADLLWRTQVRRRASNRSVLATMGATVTRKIKTPLMAIALTALVAVVVYVCAAILFGTGLPRPNESSMPIAGYLAWAAYGLVVTVAARFAPRAAVLGAAVLMTGLGVVGVTTDTVGSWAWSSFMWIAVGILIAHGLPARRAPDASTSSAQVR